MLQWKQNAGILQQANPNWPVYAYVHAVVYLQGVAGTAHALKTLNSFNYPFVTQKSDVSNVWTAISLLIIEMLC